MITGSAPLRRIVLVGMMGSGKTTVGRGLADRLGWAFWDNDATLLAATGRDARTLAATLGEDELHALELDTLARGLAFEGPAVVCAPGSAALAAPGQALLAREWVVWLRATAETLLGRVEHERDARPLLADVSAEQLHALEVVRRPGYEAVADIIVDVDHLAPIAVITKICEERDNALQSASDTTPR